MPPPPAQIEVTQLTYYPIKSCAGIDTFIAAVGDRGLEHDREWLIVDAKTNIALTQRDVAKMCLIRPSLYSLVRGQYSLHLVVPGMPEIEVLLHYENELQVKVWSDTCTAHDQGDEVAGWLSQYLERQCRLVRMAPDFVRTVNQKYAKRTTDQTGFADEFPLLLISEASLRDLNSQMAQPLPMDRFRPNIVVEGTLPYGEDDWKVIRIGEVLFDVVKPCARCVITTIDQADGSKGLEPLQTLAKTRMVDHKAMFGMNIVHHSTGKIRLGDAVEVIE
jgi:uncharacterized protein YcbX